MLSKDSNETTVTGEEKESVRSMRRLRDVCFCEKDSVGEVREMKE